MVERRAGSGKAGWVHHVCRLYGKKQLYTSYLKRSVSYCIVGDPLNTVEGSSLPRARSHLYPLPYQRTGGRLMSESSMNQVQILTESNLSYGT